MFNKLHRKDFTIAVKTGGIPNGEIKFAKEASKGELFFNTADKKLYVATTDAGATDAVLYNTDAFDASPAPYSNNFSLSLDGTNTYATLGTPYPALSGNKSIAGWFYFNSVTYQTIFGQVGASSFGAYGWFIHGANLVRFKTSAGMQGFTVPNLSLGTWYHMALTGDGTDLKLYINGVQAGGTQNDGDWTIGEFFKTDIHYHFNGYVDEIGLWTGMASGTLSAPDVAAIGNPGFAPGLRAVDLSTYAGLTHWWRFGDAGDTSATVSDQVGSNDMNLLNGPAFVAQTP